MCTLCVCVWYICVIASVTNCIRYTNVCCVCGCAFKLTHNDFWYNWTFSSWISFE